MGCRNGEVLPNAEESSFSDALLFATMCIVGLPVDVHVSNGSVYSGIFHTASVEGIVLQKARMTKKGRTESNVADGCVVGTLVILSSELVQVVAKGVLLPADGVSGKIAGDEMESAVVSTASQNFDSGSNKFGKSNMSKRRRYQRRSIVQSENGFSNGDTNGDTGTSELTHHRENGKENEGRRVVENDEGRNVGEESISKDSRTNSKVEAVPLASTKIRQVKDDKLPVEQDKYPEFELHTKKNGRSEVPDSSASFNSNSTPTQVKPVEETYTKLNPSGSVGDPVAAFVRQENQPGTRPASVDSIVHVSAPCMSTSAGARVDQSSQSSSNAVIASPTDTVQSEPSKRAKEFKLNPGAKIFSPTYTNSRSATPPVQSVPSISYIPNNSLLPVAQTEVGIGPYIPHSSVPVKVLPYNHLTPGGEIGAHPESMLGSIGSRAPLIRYASQHQTVPVGSPYVHPNSQAVMVGRMGGQVMYMPISHDLVQTVPSISPAFPRPSTTMSQVQFLKHQVAGSVPGQPLMHPPPLVGGGQHLYAPPPPPLPLMQPPFLTNRPIAVPGPNGLYTAKFS